VKILLSKEEFRIIEKHWGEIQTEIKSRVQRVDLLEQAAEKAGYSQLVRAIKNTGISFAPTVTDKQFNNTMQLINTSQSSEDIRDMLNKELGLDLTEKDARNIKQELYIKQIAKSLPQIQDMLRRGLDNGEVQVRGRANFVKQKTNKSIQEFELALDAYNKADEHDESNALKYVIKCLRDLGINSKVVLDRELTSILQQQRLDRAEMDVGRSHRL